MSSSLGYTAYRAISRRSSERLFQPSGARPDGSVLWLHAANDDNYLAVFDLAKHLCTARDDLRVLVTLPSEDSFQSCVANWQPCEAIHLENAPSEHPDAVRRFWSHWHPDMAIWVWGGLRPNLLRKVHKSGCPIALIDADESGFGHRLERWLPDLSRQLLDPFIAIFARSSDARRKLESLGIAKERITLTAPMQAGGQTLPCRDSDFSDLSDSLRGRPVWMANNVQQAEFEAVLSAHRMALRLSHRLLLLLQPAQADLLEPATAEVAKSGFRMTDWSDGGEPDDTTQVLLFTEEADLGLFYRASPVTFMGSSLVAGFRGRNPFEAAALGSAVLYGPNVRQFMPFYSRLAQVGAARIVKDANTLGAAVTRLVAPDQAASMAHAGWDVISQSADLTDRVTDLVHAMMDGETQVPNART